MDATPRELLTVARLAGHIGATPNALRSAAKLAGVRPALTIDGTPLFNADDIDAITAAVRNPTPPQLPRTSF